jgi:hypothetical protein
MTSQPGRSSRNRAGFWCRPPSWLLHRWRWAGVVLVFLLGLAPGPLRRPGLEEPVPSGPRPIVQPEMACLQELLPAGAVVLLFSSPDGAMKLDPSLHYIVQAQLAPRLLVSRPPGERSFAESSWFLGLAGGASGADTLAARHRLVVVGQCGPWSVLRRGP